MKTALWWIRRDLRLSDNQALTAALEQAEQVVPVFVLDPALLNSAYVGEKRLAFLYAGLEALAAGLNQRGSRLVVRRGDPVEVLGALRQEVEAEAIFAEADYSPYARRRDVRVAQVLPLRLLPGLTVHPPAALVKADGTPYTRFTPFSRAWQALPWPGNALPAPNWINTPDELPSEALPVLPERTEAALFPTGEGPAQKRLAAFVQQGLATYAQQRDRVDLEGTSGLSPYLRFGMLSARQAVSAAHGSAARSAQAGMVRSIDVWLNELIWREFFIAILAHFPFVRQTSFQTARRSLAWRNDPEDFAAWAEGRTGFPVVDAAMRQMLQTGWMHNRARMIAASFLTKDLLIDWRWGEKYFMQHLIDGDPAANNGGWQWTAGTGTDAAPYFRVFNPILQSQKFDPDGAYIRRFVPELSRVPLKYLHAPWHLPLDLQKQLGCRIGQDYPAPIVDHRLARQRLLQVYKAGPQVRGDSQPL